MSGAAGTPTVPIGADGRVGSPCTGVCRIAPPGACCEGLCEGCHRSLDEIAAWSKLDDDARRRVWALLPARRVPQSRT